MSDNSENSETEAEIKEPEKETQDELSSLQERLLRLGAEFENFKKRAEKDRQLSVRFANESLLRDLLPVIDHLEQALMAAKADDVIAVGVKMVLKQFEDILSRYGVKSLSALGQPFDPAKHEAVEERVTENTPAGQVIQEYQKGYWLHDRLVRPARVVVSKAV